MKCVDELLEKGQAAEAARRWSEAMEAYTQATQAFPDNVVPYQDLARIQALLGLPRSAIETLMTLVEQCTGEECFAPRLEALNRVLELDPLHHGAHNRRVDLLFAGGRSDEAIERSLELADHFLDLDQGEDGIRLLVRAFQVRPQDANLIARLAEAYLSQGQLREGKGLYRQALPSFIEQGELERAADILRRLAVVDSKDIQTFLELGDLYRKMGRLQEADQQYRAVLRIDLNHREALLRIGQCCEERQQFRDAVMVYQRILQADKEDYQARKALGIVYKHQGMQQDATKNLLMAGLGFLEKSDREVARECFSEVLSIDPNNAIAARQLQTLA